MSHLHEIVTNGSRKIIFVFIFVKEILFLALSLGIVIFWLGGKNGLDFPNHDTLI